MAFYTIYFLVYDIYRQERQHNKMLSDLDKIRQARLRVLEQNIESRNRSKVLTTLYKQQTQKKNFPLVGNEPNEYINLISQDPSMTESVEMLAQQVTSKLQEVMGPTNAADLAKRLYAVDPLLHRELLIQWPDIKREMLVRFARGGTAEIIYEYIAGQVAHKANKFQPILNMTNDPIVLPQSNNIMVNPSIIVPTSRWSANLMRPVGNPAVQNNQVVINQPQANALAPLMLPSSSSSSSAAGSKAPSPSLSAAGSKAPSPSSSNSSKTTVPKLQARGNAPQYTGQLAQLTAMKKDEIKLAIVNHVQSLDPSLDEAGINRVLGDEFNKFKIDRIQQGDEDIRTRTFASALKEQLLAFADERIMTTTRAFRPSGQPLIDEFLTQAPAKESGSSSDKMPSAADKQSAAAGGKDDEPLPTGSGLRRRKVKHLKSSHKKKPMKKTKPGRKYIITGRGSPVDILEQKPFYINVDSLNQSPPRLSIRYKNSRRYLIPSTVISDGVKEVLMQAFTQGSFNQPLFNRLETTEDKMTVERVIHLMGVSKELKHYDQNKVTQEQYERVDVLRGAIDAGNNSPAVKLQLRHGLQSLVRAGLMTRSDASRYLVGVN